MKRLREEKVGKQRKKNKTRELSPDPIYVYELLEKIVSYCELDGYFAASLTCKSWNRLDKNIEEYVGKIMKDGFGPSYYRFNTKILRKFLYSRRFFLNEKKRFEILEILDREEDRNYDLYAGARRKRMETYNGTLGDLNGNWTVLFRGILPHKRSMGLDSMKYEKEHIFLHVGSKNVGKKLLNSFYDSYIFSNKPALGDWLMGIHIEYAYDQKHEYIIHAQFPVDGSDNEYSNRVRCFRFGLMRKVADRHEMGNIETMKTGHDLDYFLECPKEFFCMIADSVSRWKEKWIKPEEVLKEFTHITSIKVSLN